jgi:drug/metabolite transporter (DMT)-like permease
MLTFPAAVAAAIAINLAYVIQYEGLSVAPRVVLGRPLASVAALLHNRRWVGGALLGYAGLALEALALTSLPLSTVQATIAAGLLVVAVLTRAVDGASLGRVAPAGALLAIVALVLLAIVAPYRRHQPPDPWALAAAIGAAAALAAAVVRLRPTPSWLGLAAGVLYGATSLALAAVAPVAAGHVPPAAVLAVALGGGAVVTAGGFLTFQRALQLGRPLPVVTVMTAATSVVAIIGGLVLLGDRLAPAPEARVVQVAALAMAAGSALLVLRAGGAAPAPAQELPGLLGGADPEVGPVRAGPGVGAADEAQVLHRRAVSAWRPRQP